MEEEELYDAFDEDDSSLGEEVEANEGKERPQDEPQPGIEGPTEDHDFCSVKHEDEEKTFTPEEISSMVLTKVNETAEAYLGYDVKEAEVTVPA